MESLSVFASPDFNPNDYANAILAGHPSSKHSQDIPAKEDISLAISKLTFAIDDVSKQIKNAVAAHHEDLLSQAASANNLSGSITSVRLGLDDLDASLEKLRLKIRVPYHSIEASVSRLHKLQQASDVLRRTSRFVILARRLQLQMGEMENASASATDGRTEGTAGNTDTSDTNGLYERVSDVEDDKERIIAKAALSIAELVALLDAPKVQKHATGAERRRNKGGSNKGRTDEDVRNELDIPLRLIDAVAAHVPFIEEARAKVTNEMETMVLAGLSTLNQSLLASSLQTAYNLRVLPELVQNLIFDLSQAVEERIQSAFDISKISKDALAKEPIVSPSPQSPPIYRSRVRTEPTNVTAPQFTTALWSRLEGMTGDMAECCIKVYTLEKVLKMKKDTVTQALFLDEAMKVMVSWTPEVVLENKPSTTFWTSLGRSLEKHARDSAKGSTFLQQALGSGYPKLLRLFQEFFTKIAVHTDTVYGQSYQSPETVVVLRSLSSFESLYLLRSSNKLNEAVAQAFSGGIRVPPGYNEGISIARTVTNELDSARFDPLLVKAVARNVVSSLDMMLSRGDGIVVKDRSAVNLIGPTATPQQISNAHLATCLFQCFSRLEALQGDHTEAVFSILRPSIQNIHQAYEHLVEPITTAIRRELGALIDKLHRIDFGKSMDSTSGLGGPSFYMKELVEKLSFIKTEILSQFNMGEAGRAWITSIVRFVIRIFVMHISIARPLGESGKLQLTSDMTELEFALSAFMVDNPQSKRGVNLESIGDDYRTLRAMRPLLFLENALLADAERTAGLPPLVVLHHILVRSPIPLPHDLHGWQEAEYVRWVDEHTEREALTLIESGLSHWEKVSQSEDKNGEEYINLARTVLNNAYVHME